MTQQDWSAAAVAVVLGTALAVLAALQMGAARDDRRVMEPTTAVAPLTSASR